MTVEELLTLHKFCPDAVAESAPGSVLRTVEFTLADDPAWRQRGAEAIRMRAAEIRGALQILGLSEDDAIDVFPFCKL